MTVELGWQPGEDGQMETWWVDGGQPAQVLCPGARIVCKPARPGRAMGRAERLAGRIPGMMHLEGLIDLDTLRLLFTDPVPLYLIWVKL